jgi:16S rRNA (guanine(966)-N(2))-methyltransferase RsmD
MAKSDPKRNQPDLTLRIVGGAQRGRKIRYNGDLATRPMKDRVREAVFNLVGPAIKGTRAFDLFAGTGAVALEALSRGAIQATAIERRFDMAKLIEQNAADIGLAERLEVVPGNTFLWARELEALRQSQDETPWSIFCCPPYAFYHDRLSDLTTVLERFLQLAPDGSMLLVEADEPFDFADLPDGKARTEDGWDVRTYAPAQVGILRMHFGQA